MMFSLVSWRTLSAKSSGPWFADNKKQDATLGSTPFSVINSGIPEALSFDRIMAGGTCPPCTVRDFLNYLKYIRFSAEHLQFYLWFRDYSQRFGRLDERETALSPPWVATEAQLGILYPKPSQVLVKGLDPVLAQVLQEWSLTRDRAQSQSGFQRLFWAPLNIPSLDGTFDASTVCGTSLQQLSETTHSKIAELTFKQAGMDWKPFTMQPYRDEIDRVIAIYLSQGGARELNLTSREKQAVMRALQHTTHPSGFAHAVAVVEDTLRHQAHPEFIRWAISNGNRPRVVFARALGAFGIASGLVSDLALTLSRADRAWRILPIIAWLVGFATIIAASNGMCVVLHGLHHRQLRPWELLSDDGGEDPSGSVTALSKDSVSGTKSLSYEDEPWVPRYRRRNIVRKIFDREIWIREPALRRVQNKVFLRAVLGGSLLAAVFVGIFAAVPSGDFF